MPFFFLASSATLCGHFLTVKIMVLVGMVHFRSPRGESSQRPRAISRLMQKLIDTSNVASSHPEPLRILLLMAQLQLQRFLALLELDQSLGQGRDRLCQVFGRACDPERNGTSHGRAQMRLDR